MVSVRRHHRHCFDDRLHGLLEPAFPFPFAVVGVSVFDEVTGEAAEPRLRNGLDSRQRATACFLDIGLVHDMAVAHDEEGELTLGSILRAEMADRTPVAFISHTPGIGSTRRQVFRQCFMADIFIPCAGSNPRCIDDIARLTGVAQSFRLLRSSSDSRSSFKVFLRCVLHGNDLYSSLGDAIVGEPAETHPCLGVTIDGSHHTIGFLFRHQILNRLIQRRFIRLG